MKTTIAAIAASAVMLMGGAHAAITGVVPGPDDGFSIGFIFTNDMAADIVSISIDGTPSDPDLIWDSVFNVGGTADAPSSTDGIDTAVLTGNWLAGGFQTGETFSFSVDPDFVGDPSASIVVSQLAGTLVSVLFADASIFSGIFVDDPADGAGLMLVSADPVPVPGALVLMGTALAGFAGLRRKKAA
jgi:hypothetical protein